MGLGFPENSPDNIESPIITAVNSGILDTPVVTLFFKSQGPYSTSNAGGVITYGALDTVNCDRNIVYEPLASPNKFEIFLTKAALGSREFSGNWNTSIDTTMEILTAPRSIVQAFAQELGADYNTLLNYYTIDCGIKFNLNLTIGNTVYTLTEKEMTTKYSSDTCLFALGDVYDDKWTLGATWFMGFCNIFDYSNQRIGFASVIGS